MIDDVDTRYVRKASVIDSWAEWTINFSEFSGLRITTIKQMNIVYEDWSIGGAGGNKVGGIYIDDIRFE